MTQLTLRDYRANAYIRRCARRRRQIRTAHFQRLLLAVTSAAALVLLAAFRWA